MLERDPVAVIDLFAGPGGLGEGFNSLQRSDNRPCFKVRLSIEKDFHAHQTLLLRAFFRQFSAGRVPGLYYDVLRGTAEREILFKRFPEQAIKATAEAWHAELGIAPYGDVRDRIKTAYIKETGEEAREPLLPIKPADLGEEVFRVDLSWRNTSTQS
jgi:site-specific DNA-cytosine methylase